MEVDDNVGNNLELYLFRSLLLDGTTCLNLVSLVLGLILGDITGLSFGAIFL